MLLEALFLCVKKIINNLLNFIYPPQCILCEKNSKYYICDKCNKLINKYESNLYLKKEEDNNINRSYNYLFYIFRYEKLIRKIMINYKFYSKSYIAYFFANRILNNPELSNTIKQYDYIVPVPMGKSKEHTRGYNQTILITQIISESLKIKHDTSLQKIDNTSTQSQLNKEDRKSNIEGAFYLKNKEIYKDKKIILLDDIYTTGSTIEECAKTIKQAGARKIFIIILARDFMK